MNDWGMTEIYISKEKFLQKLENVCGDIFQETYDKSCVTGYSLELIKELMSSLKRDEIISISSRERELIEKDGKGQVLIIPDSLWLIGTNGEIEKTGFNKWLNKYVKI